MVTVQTKIITKSGKLVEAKLFGARGGDLFGGYVKEDGKWVDMENKPNLFPFKVTTKTPFVDVGKPVKPTKSQLAQFKSSRSKPFMEKRITRVARGLPAVHHKKSSAPKSIWSAWFG